MHPALLPIPQALAILDHLCAEARAHPRAREQVYLPDFQPTEEQRAFDEGLPLDAAPIPCARLWPDREAGRGLVRVPDEDRSEWSRRLEEAARAAGYETARRPGREAAFDFFAWRMSA